MSDSILDDDFENEGFGLESEQIGKTSDESPTDKAKTAAAEGSAAATGTEPAKKRVEFSIFDAMLLLSLICVTLATLVLVFELRKFGNFPFSFPWRTSEFLNVLGF